MIRKITLLFSFLLMINCSDTANLQNCIRTLPLNILRDLNNPELINVQTPGGFSEIVGGNKGILLFNKNGTEFVAFDKMCPVNDCTSPMIFENRKLKCSCDNSEYSVDFGGAPQTNGFECPAIEYRVVKNGSTLQISSFN
jgi:nitrite reductase/ring-hydroxylating ferredoxin subunit